MMRAFDDQPNERRETSMAVDKGVFGRLKHPNTPDSSVRDFEITWFRTLFPNFKLDFLISGMRKNGTVPCRKPQNLDVHVEQLTLNTNSNALNRDTLYQAGVQLTKTSICRAKSTY